MLLTDRQSGERRPLSSVEIAALLPHRAPLLLVDRMIDMEPGLWGKAIKNITAGDPLLVGHFPGMPIMPGVLIAEACGQVAAVVCAAENPKDEPLEELPAGEPVDMLAMIERFKFVRKVVPGDQLILEASIAKRFQNMIRIEVKARVGHNLVAEGILVATRAA
jgi:3-hydroxyacyl-[acyl-carrier-protein] dehydratase